MYVLVTLSAFHICIYNMYTPTIQSFTGFIISQYGTGCGFRGVGFGIALLSCWGFEGVTAFFCSGGVSDVWGLQLQL